MKAKTYEQCVASQQEANAIAKTLIGLMADRGWKVHKNYTAEEGSTYLQFAEIAGNECISGKVRIADHEEQSSSHVAPEVEILYGPEFFEPDLIAAANAIACGESGQF